MKQITLRANSEEDVRTQLNDLEAKSFHASLAFIFILDRSLSLDLVQPFHDLNIEIFASCSAELIYNGGKSEFSIIALLLEIPREYFRLKVFKQDMNSTLMGNEIAQFALSSFHKPSILLLLAFRDLNFEPEKLIQGILDTESTLKIFGGIASSFGEVEHPPFLSKQGFETQGACALIFDQEKIEINGLAVSGWQELGTPKKVTRAEGRKVFEIEGMPATDFYARYFGI